MIKVSIIVPIYNAGAYLKDCLDALHAQTMQDAEFILVLDCPTDGSDDVAKQYAQNDSRFVIVKNDTNLHIGKSRNKGIDIAKGEYIAFCDHDDVMVPDMYEKLYHIAQKNNADCVISIPTIEENTIKTYWSIQTLDKTKNKKQIILKDLLSYGGTDQAISKYCYIHNVIYRTKVIKEHTIRFVDTHIITNEDVIFNIEFILRAHTIITFNESLYTHRLIQTSTGHQQTYLDWKKRFQEVEYVYQLLVNTKVYEMYKEDFYLMAQKKFLDGIIAILLHKEGLTTLSNAYRYIKSTPYGKLAFKNYRDNIQRPLLKKSGRKLIAAILAL